MSTQHNRHQEEHAEKLQASMNNIMDEITQLRHKQTMMKAAIQDAKWKQANLTRRVLKVGSMEKHDKIMFLCSLFSFLLCFLYCLAGVSTRGREEERCSIGPDRGTDSHEAGGSVHAANATHTVPSKSYKICFIGLHFAFH